MPEAIAELVNMAREADECRKASIANGNAEGAYRDGLSAYFCMEAARRLAKRHGLPKPMLKDGDDDYYMRITP